MNNLPQREKENQRLNDYRIKMEELQPDMPRFDSYYDTKGRCLHPFEPLANSFDPDEIRTPDDDNFEKAEEERLYHRELLGRLIGKKLNTRQFEVLTGQFNPMDHKMDHVQNWGKEIFTGQRDRIRIFEEVIESYRRRQVLQGKWTEEESHNNLRAHVANVI